ncbi:nucleotidyltransferase [Paraburkholderia sp. CNPSo 3272]|uniref:SMODS domain-containing nucleotidyltransferase n=1 Tax=Paraburkholderia sp. CNPSo 3272 TaxID=2940931 RepID=UPI0020B89B83|nr:nucleotidyltransferase [Paraburkholderia sp. CNPSo 3272]MCP3724721.1 nucleotidyltransferase [Paraburkholderia sp. CNPSo 3272]
MAVGRIWNNTGKGKRMGEGEWFAAFCGALTIGRTQRDSIAYRTGRIMGQLNHDLRALDSKTSNRFYVGSYGRNTAIPSVSDVDVIYELPASLYVRFNGHVGNGQSALLNLVKNSIENTYPRSAVVGDGQVVVIRFNDGIKFEILPAFLNTEGTYTFPNSNGGGAWRECKPKQEMAAFSKRNAECNANLVPLCRMIRAWRDRNNVDMSGMLIDTLAYQFIATWEHRDKSYVYYDYPPTCLTPWSLRSGQLHYNIRRKGASPRSPRVSKNMLQCRPPTGRLPLTSPRR